MLAVYECLALAQTAQIWRSVKKSQVARTRAKVKRHDTEQCQDGWAASGAEVETLAEKNTSKDVALPLLPSRPMMQSVSNRPTLRSIFFCTSERKSNRRRELAYEILQMASTESDHLIVLTSIAISAWLRTGTIQFEKAIGLKNIYIILI